MEKETKFEVVLETLAFFALMGCVLALGFWGNIMVSGGLYAVGWFLHFVVVHLKDARKVRWDKLNEDVLDSDFLEKNA